jgi:prepilin-type N-terminal cleavage/methylation domain-containing protein
MKRKRKGFTLVELLVVIAIIALLMGILMPALARVRQIAFRMICGSNLSGIGRAMLIYANDYDNDFPRAGFVGTIWVDELTNWAAADRMSAYGFPGGATMSSSFYLLVKYAEVTPKSFACKSQSSVTAFKVEDYSTFVSADTEDEDVWDFGPGTSVNEAYSPANHCSYSYHNPYNRFFLCTASSEPGMAVAADRNPWLDPGVVTIEFTWDSYEKIDGISRYQYGNAGAHQREGQNVLFMDNHVDFEKQSFCGIEEDNIYTYYDSSSGDVVQQGIPPVCASVEDPEYGRSFPMAANDSFLLNECPPYASGGGPIEPPPIEPPP